MPRFLLQIDGLTAARSLVVGSVTIHPPDRLPQLVDRGALHGSAQQGYDSIVSGAFAEFEADEIDVATGAVRDALDGLRLFQFARRTMQSTMFGLPGDLSSALLSYVQIDDERTPGIGFRRLGDFVGFTFTDEALDDWEGSKGFQFMSRALADPLSSEGASRAARGAKLLGRAARLQDADLKILGVQSALEALLLDRRHGAQTHRLARHVAWFGCGLHDKDLCGRDRPVCPYLHLSPDSKPDQRRLKVLRKLGDEFVVWRCSEWHQAVDWYDARSEGVHGDPSAVSERDAGRAEYWIDRWLVEPILEWLSDHPTTPSESLDAELNKVASPAGWQKMIAALDSPTPPREPPLGDE